MLSLGFDPRGLWGGLSNEPSQGVFQQSHEPLVVLFKGLWVGLVFSNFCNHSFFNDIGIPWILAHSRKGLADQLWGNDSPGLRRCSLHSCLELALRVDEQWEFFVQALEQH